VAWLDQSVKAAVALLFSTLLGSVVAGEFADDFRHGTGQWAVEQQPGGSVGAEAGVLRIDDAGGCTVWFRPKLTAPLTIRYEARVLSSGRVSDLNCFWLARDPRRPDLLAPGHARDGKFAAYDSLETYYVGYGGNDNTTTRFRRYDGTGARPLDPAHDKRAAKFLLQADHWYEIELQVTAAGHARFLRDGEVIFDFADPAPLTEGWFGLRTVHSQIEVRNFRVLPAPADSP
jgi:hypothetical protein